jgi:hypothetical protein
MLLRGITIFAAFQVVACVSGAAEERPTRGMLYNTSEWHSLSYECSLSGANLDCSFTQVAVRPKAKPQELNQTLSKARADFRSFKENLSKECGEIGPIYEAIALGRIPPGADPQKYAEGMSKMHPMQKADTANMLQRLHEVCQNPTEAKFLDFARFNHEKETRTCKVSTNTYRQRFRKVGEDGPWVVVDSPNGSCGVVNVSRFEQSPSSSETDTSSSFRFWTYYAKKVVTNKRGEAFPGLSCSGLDEAEYFYDWKSNETYANCDYIEFSPI